MIEILCCGDRDWDDYQTIYAWIRDMIEENDTSPRMVRIIHGGARGADKLSGEMAKKIGCKVKSYAAEWKQFGPAAGPIRNKMMLDKHPKISRVLAFHNNIAVSRGTVDMIKKANRKGITVLLIPSGGRDK